jgi:hypothetical protein
LNVAALAARTIVIVNAIADRKLRHAFALKCAGMADEVLEFYIDIFRDQSRSLSERQHAADWIINRAFGRVPLPVETTEEADRNVHHTYTVRWLPPDPNDHSVAIEPC